MTRWAILGGLLGGGLITGVGMYVKFRELQTPAFTQGAQAEATAAASRAIADHYGLTPQVIQRIGQVATRFRT